jgi:cell division transport system ATP-binding protein
MSRTPVKVLNKTELSEPVEMAIVRVLRAAATAGGSGSLTFALASGGAQILLGGAGSGKTTMLEMIAMARPPARGGAELFGEDLASLRPEDRPRLRRRIGMVFQTPWLAGELSAHDNLALAVRAAERHGEPFENDIRELLAWVGLGRRSHFRPEELDIEGRRRLALARSVINRPELVIVDEPAGEGGMAILRLLADLNAAGTPLLMATRDEALAEGCGAEVTRLGGGGGSDDPATIPESDLTSAASPLEAPS